MVRLQARRIGLFLASNLAAAAFFVAPGAHAQTLLSPTGGKGQLVFDNLTGLRANTTQGVSYSGFIGFQIERYGQNVDLGGNTSGTAVIHSTTLWLAPQADYFIINHLSLGGLVEIASTSGSEDIPLNAAQTQSTDLPTTTDLTLLPRIGWMFALGDRFGIWPRGGLGYALRQSSNPGGNGKLTFSGVIINATCPFLYRINETFFVELSPDLTWIPGSTSTTNNANQTVSQSASYLQFGASGGLGVMLDL
jgi:hypothetical protein